jgi:hypothetical protein
MSNITSVTLPNTLTTIGERAFYRCYALNSITLPDSLTTIGKRAFYRCNALNSITIPSLVTTIGENAFGNTPLSGCDIKPIIGGVNGETYSFDGERCVVSPRITTTTP